MTQLTPEDAKKIWTEFLKTIPRTEDGYIDCDWASGIEEWYIDIGEDDNMFEFLAHFITFINNKSLKAYSGVST